VTPGGSGENVEQHKNIGRLILILDEAVIGEYPLDKDVISIGRLPDNDIRPNDPAVSRKHAQIKLEGERVLLEDLGSTNGTLVNGRKVKSCVLRDGDLVQVGRHQVRYLADKAAGREAPVSGERAAPASGGSAHIRVLDGPDAGKVVHLNKAVTALGRLGGQVTVISRRPEGYTIINIGLDKGLTLLNGRSIGTTRHALHPHDIIELAGEKMEFLLDS
jgi:FHA domain-containing protein